MDTFQFTDLGNAKRLLAKFGLQMRYCSPEGKWFLWNGLKWDRDLTGDISNLASATVEAIPSERSQYPDSEGRKELEDHAKKSQSLTSMTSMVKIARSRKEIAILPDKFDTQPTLLNCKNGVVDLETGKLHPHDPGYLMRKMCPVDYDPNASHELLDYFLESVTVNDSDFISFLKNAFGYSLTALTLDEKMFLVQGSGATGKSTFLEAIKAVMGDYALTADFNTFARQNKDQGGNDHSGDLARLVGTRMVATSEIEQGRKLGSKIVKSVTGGETITARPVRGHIFQYTPFFKLWISGNYPPQVGSEDEAIWRRMVKIPFDAVVPVEKRDPNVKRLMTSNQIVMRALLRWGIEGARQYLKEGKLLPYSKITEATENYRTEMDPTSRFLEQCCTLEEEALTPVVSLRGAYMNYQREDGTTHELSPLRFNRLIEGRGCRRATRKVNGFDQKCWVGIKILP